MLLAFNLAIHSVLNNMGMGGVLAATPGRPGERHLSLSAGIPCLVTHPHAAGEPGRFASPAALVGADVPIHHFIDRRASSVASTEPDRGDGGGWLANPWARDSPEPF